MLNFWHRCGHPVPVSWFQGKHHSTLYLVVVHFALKCRLLKQSWSAIQKLNFNDTYRGPEIRSDSNSWDFFNLSPTNLLLSKTGLKVTRTPSRWWHLTCKRLQKYLFFSCNGIGDVVEEVIFQARKKGLDFHLNIIPVGTAILKSTGKSWNFLDCVNFKRRYNFWMVLLGMVLGIKWLAMNKKAT